MLKTALNDLDPSFIRAEAALQVDLAIAMSQAKMGEEASRQKVRASALAAEVGSQRQYWRLAVLA